MAKQRQIKQRYWDSDVFLGLFNEEKDKVNKCKGVIRLAEDGEITIVTSALTLTEVVWIKGLPRLSEESEDKIRRFFEQGYIAVRPVDRVIAEDARQLIWKHGVQPKDAIHVATALELELSVLDTFDGELHKLDGKLGSPVLRIGPPDVSCQESLPLDGKPGDQGAEK
ncbi:MAG: type II toxin-antitoxin system VapC family toxin [candidate division Zixibacteria bacterium]|nr:type II toxin-antitoxin system VapC family toxin [candidate division Zixibacteria bacterium]